ncbi:MAG: hypothetical protein H7335_15210 [Massilia sp.]|nr:hypothetical protein [Massilia sp.]
MKRLPILLSLCALIALSASLAYWLLQLYQPAQRPLAALPATALAEPSVDAAATLFGGQASTALASNYQLTGVIVAGRDSVAIIVADGSPPKALKLGREVVSGVAVQEVHPRYVLLADGGVLKRIELASDGKVVSSSAALLPAPQARLEAQQFQQQQPEPPQPPQPPPPQQEPTQPQQTQQPQDAAPAQAPTMPAPVDATAPSNANALPFPGTPPRPPVQMPPPTRGVSTGGQQLPSR